MSVGMSIIRTAVLGLVASGGMAIAEDLDWGRIDAGTTDNLRSVWGAGPDCVFVAGNNGTIIRWDGASWAAMVSGTTVELRGLWGTGPNDVFAVGATGTILHYDGSTWDACTSGTTVMLHSVWGTASNDVFVAGGDGGSGGTILHYDGNDWSPMTIGITYRVNGVWGSGPADVFAVAEYGSILHYDGMTWQPMTSGATQALFGVWGTASDNVYAVGIGGTIWHFDGTAWSPSGVASASALLALWGTAPDNVYTAGWWDGANTILHYDGSSWSPTSTGTNEFLNDVWGSSPSDVYGVGNNGVVLHYPRPPVWNLTKDACYHTIQDALDHADNGDEIVLSPGIYQGHGNRDLDALGKAVTIRSIDPNDPNVVDATIIDCQGSPGDYHRGFFFHSGEGPDTIIDGITITNGYVQSLGGGGILCYPMGPDPNRPSPTIQNCTITNNAADGVDYDYGTIGFSVRGGGVFGCDGAIINCRIVGTESLANSGY